MGTPKTKSSYRNISISKKDVEVLKLFKERQELNKLIKGSEYHDNGFVCAEPNGNPLRNESLSSSFKRLMTKNGYSISYHDLRHSHATILLMEKNIPVKRVSSRLGHSSTAFTMDIYVHALFDKQEDIANLMEDTLYGDIG